MRLRFDPGEPEANRKHAPVADAPTYRVERGRVVSKCARGISRTDVESLLNAEDSLWVFESDPTEDALPQAVYAVRGGVLYRAVPTGTGSAGYHGFPETSASFAAFCRTRVRRDRVWAWADAHGTRETIEAWFEETESWRGE